MDEQFQKTVLSGVETISAKTETLVKNYDNLQSETKKAFEELTRVKNVLNDTTETLNSIKKVQAALNMERTAAWGDPVKRLLADQDKRDAINVAIRAAIGQNVDLKQRAGAIASGSTPGSTMIIGQLASEIYSVLSQYGVWNTFAVRQLGTKTTTFPVATARPLATCIVSEGGQISEDSTKDATSVDCTPVAIAALLYATTQMLEDGEFDIASMIMDEFAQAFAYRLDWMCLAADGTNDATDGAATGIFSGGTAAGAGSGNTSVAALELDDFTKCLATVAPAVLSRPARWWVHPTVLAKMIGIRDSNGRSIFLTANEAPSFGAMGSILGYPVTLCDAAPSTDSTSSVVAVFGDPNGMVVGVRTAWEFMASDQYKFDYLRRYFRGVGRAMPKIRAATAFAKLTTAAS